MHLLPRAKHSEQMSGLSGAKMHLILRRRPVLIRDVLDRMTVNNDEFQGQQGPPIKADRNKKSAE
jgi:hypothetical protein